MLKTLKILLQFTQFKEFENIFYKSLTHIVRSDRWI